MKITIESPCGQRWDKMKPAENGRLCLACNKVVVDFTKMSNEEIISYFSTNCEQKTCGRFNTFQINHKKGKAAHFLLGLNERIDSHKSLFGFKWFAPSVIGLLLFAMGCEKKTTGEPLPDTTTIETNKIGSDTLNITTPGN